MTSAQAPLSSENALKLLKMAVDRDPGQQVLDRVAAHLELSIAAGLIPSAASIATAGSTPTAATGKAATSVPGTVPGSLVASSKMVLGLTLLAGVGIGIGVDRWAISMSSRSSVEARAVAGSAQPAAVAAPLLDPAPPTETVPTVRAEDLPRLPAALQKRPPAELAPGQATSANPADSASASLPVAREEQASSHQTSLREQQALLDQARLALGKGEPARCLAAIATHRGRFPQSLLAEERDALTIKALAASGNLRVAREQLVTFVASYPRSLMTESLEATVRKVQ